MAAPRPGGRRGLHRRLPLAREPDRSDVGVHRETPKPRTPEQIEDDESGPVGRLRSKGYMDSFINRPSTSRPRRRRRKTTRSRSGGSRITAARRARVLDRARSARALATRLLEIVRDEAYYFAPQAMTKIMNEGWASYWHSKILTEKALTAAESDRLRRRECRRARDVAGPLEPVQARRRAVPQHRGRWNKGQFARVGRV